MPSAFKKKVLDYLKCWANFMFLKIPNISYSYSSFRRVGVLSLLPCFYVHISSQYSDRIQQYTEVHNYLSNQPRSQGKIFMKLDIMFHFFPTSFLSQAWQQYPFLLPSEQACCSLYLVLFMDSPITIDQYGNWFMTFTPISRIATNSVKRLYMKIFLRE